jgi:hypothetical protein
MFAKIRKKLLTPLIFTQQYNNKQYRKEHTHTIQKIIESAERRKEKTWKCTTNL